MNIDASQVRELRSLSGAGILDCKKALQETGGDLEAAQDFLRKKGMSAAAKKGARVAAQGKVAVAVSGNRGVMVEVNCETDFVERNDDFTGFVDALVDEALTAGVCELDALLAMPFMGKTVEEARQELIGKIGENIQIRRVTLVEASGLVGSYLHGHRIGVLVALDTQDEALAKDLAMHVAAARPTAVLPSDVSASVIEKEREIYTGQAEQSGKPAEIMAKIIDGKLKKFLDDVSLVGQAFVKDPDTRVGDLLKQKQSQVESFVCFEVGEGIEKKEEDFAAEVKAQIERSR